MIARKGSWSLIVTDPESPARTMAIDEALLAAAIDRDEPDPQVRIYRWGSPALSVGAKLDVPRSLAVRCRAAGVELVRRPTGGGAVLHDDDLTYSVVLRDEGAGVLGVYRKIAHALIHGLGLLGVNAKVVEHQGRGGAGFACFASSTGADIAVSGRKICGSAQARRRGYVLQHGSVPIRDLRRQTSALLPTSRADNSTCLQELAPGGSWQLLAKALEEGFSQLFGGEPTRRALSGDELVHTDRFEPAYGQLLLKSLVIL